jgi:hypothetical protein
MKFTTLFYAVKAGSANILKRHPLLDAAAVVMLAAQVMPNIAWAQAQLAPPLAGVLGKVQSFTGSSLDVATAAGPVHVTVTQPLATYKQIPSELSHVAPTSYVGVASVQQADGTELAKQVIIFPKELSGAAEGSVLLDAPGASTHSRMTNGSVSSPAASHSRMTNGTVQKGGGSTLVVRYQDGSQTISVPAGVPVTLVAKTTVTLGVGDTIIGARKTWFEECEGNYKADICRAGAARLLGRTRLFLLRRNLPFKWSHRRKIRMGCMGISMHLPSSCRGGPRQLERFFNKEAHRLTGSVGAPGRNKQATLNREAACYVLSPSLYQQTPSSQTKGEELASFLAYDEINQKFGLHRAGLFAGRLPPYD